MTTINRITMREAQHLLGRSRCSVEWAINSGKLRGGTDRRLDGKFKVWWVDYDDAKRLAKEIQNETTRERDDDDAQ